jgi:hypothetical protein
MSSRRRSHCADFYVGDIGFRVGQATPRVIDNAVSERQTSG